MPRNLHRLFDPMKVVVGNNNAGNRTTHQKQDNVLARSDWPEPLPKVQKVKYRSRIDVFAYLLLGFGEEIRLLQDGSRPRRQVRRIEFDRDIWLCRNDGAFGRGKRISNELFTAFARYRSRVHS